MYAIYGWLHVKHGCASFNLMHVGISNKCVCEVAR